MRQSTVFNTPTKREPIRVSAFGLIFLAGGFLFTTTLSAQSGPRPGANNPAGSPNKLTLFPDESVFSFSPDGNGAAKDIVTRFYRTGNSGAQLSLEDVSSLNVSNNRTAIAAASGRIFDPGRASVVSVQRTPATSQLQMTVYDNYNSVTPMIVGNDLADRTGSSTADQVTVATGDLDKALDSNYNYHDEVAVVYQSQASPPNQIKVTVFNFANWTSGNQQVPQATIRPSSNWGVFLGGPDVSVGAAIGDFEGDGRNELVVGWVSPGALCFSWFRYTSDGHGGGSLQTIANNACEANPSIKGTLSLQAGDFNGDGKDELAVGYMLGNTPTLEVRSPRGLVFQRDGGVSLPNVPSGGVVKIQVAAGQFIYNPSTNPSIKFGQEQLAVAWNDSASEAVDIQLYSVSSDLRTFTRIGNTAYAKASPEWFGVPSYLFSLAAGGFAGTNGPGPTASLALSVWTQNTVTSGVYWIRTIAADSSGLTFKGLRTFATGDVDYYYRVPVVAVDWDGKSVFLGAPAHITLQNAVSTDYIVEEPPKHSFWDGTKIANVSNFADNNVSFSYTAGQTDSSTSQDQATWSNGTSTSLSAGATFGYSKNFLLGSASAQASVDITKKGSSVYNEDKNSYNSQYGSRTFAITSRTDHDDYLYGRLQTTDIWRFRIYAISQSTPQLNNFYEVVFPGPVVRYNGGGLGFDWYQPVHENGNILTYPQWLGTASNNPVDLGSFADSNGNSITAPLVSSSQWAFDGTSGTQTLSLSNAGGSGHSITYGHDLASSLDINTSIQVSAEIGGFTGEVRTSGSVEFSNNSSWSNTKTSDTTTTTETTATLNRKAGNSSQAYQFYPLVYITKDGTFKMSFDVNNPASTSNSGSSYWSAIYGHTPDPALNLPYRFTPGSSSGWLPNDVSKRKQLRGLFFRKTSLNSMTSSYDLLRNAAVDGDQVRIELRVYNESTGQGADNITVSFQKIAYDSSKDNEICTTPINAGVSGGQLCPASARTDIGQTTLAHLDPLQFTCVTGIDDPGTTGCANTPVFINWNTTGSGPATAGATGEYRIYVVLQPSNPSELYGLDGTPVAIQSITNGSPIMVTTAGPHGLHTGDYITLGAPGLHFPQTTRNIFQVTYVNDTTVNLNGTTDVPGSYLGGGTVTLLNPGENDEGYYRFEVQNKPAQNPTPSAGPSDSLAQDSLQALDPRTGELISGNSLIGNALVVNLNQPMQIRIGVFSSAPHPDGETLLLFDGNPANGAPAIASQLVHPGDNNGQGAYAWFDWTPATPGTHNLYTQLLSGQGTSMLPVLVK